MKSSNQTFKLKRTSTFTFLKKEGKNGNAGIPSDTSTTITTLPTTGSLHCGK